MRFTDLKRLQLGLRHIQWMYSGMWCNNNWHPYTKLMRQADLRTKARALIQHDRIITGKQQ